LAFCAKYETLVDALEAFLADLSRKNIPNHGYAIDHDLLVAAYCLMIVPNDKQREGELAAIAGLLHSMDRHFKSGQMERDQIERFISLLPESVTDAELALIRQAIAEHSKKKVDVPSDVTFALQDADKLANSGFLSLARGGQQHPHLPAILLDHVETPDPKHGFADDTRTNIFGLWDFCIEWEDMLHFEISKVIAKMSFSIAGTKYAKAMVIWQFRHAGLI
jgi:predicted hydrolase (HD superfamily)